LPVNNYLVDYAALGGGLLIWPGFIDSGDRVLGHDLPTLL